jgi:cell division protein ZapA (FtsZ GTPase activity inhibitor)
MEQEQIIVIIQDQEYKIKCSPEQVNLLQKSAAYLDMKMSETKTASPSMAKEKIAVMSALNVVSEYLSQEEQVKEYSDACEEIDLLSESLREYGTDQ